MSIRRFATNGQENKTIEQHNGSAVHGELVVDLTDTPSFYVGGSNGQLIKLLTGGTGSNVSAVNLSADAIITGNLTVNGTTTTLNSATLDVVDKNITIAKGSSNASVANGAGITVDGAGTSLVYNSLSNAWVFDRTVIATSFSGNINAANVVGNVANADYALRANYATYSTAANSAQYADTASNAVHAQSVEGSGVIGSVPASLYANAAGTAYIVQAGNIRGSVANAVHADEAQYAYSSLTANSANLADTARYSYNSDNANYAANAGNATFAAVANYANSISGGLPLIGTVDYLLKTDGNVVTQTSYIQEDTANGKVNIGTTIIQTGGDYTDLSGGGNVILPSTINITGADPWPSGSQAGYSFPIVINGTTYYLKLSDSP